MEKLGESKRNVWKSLGKSLEKAWEISATRGAVPRRAAAAAAHMLIYGSGETLGSPGVSSASDGA
jgi:hypothetical protein